MAAKPVRDWRASRGCCRPISWKPNCARRSRERQKFDAEVLSSIEWILPDRPLAIELARALQAGYLRGADLWHIATALYIAPRAEEIGFITLDGPQREVAAALGFQVGTGWPIADSG